MGRRITASASFFFFLSLNLSLHSLSNANSILRVLLCGNGACTREGCQISPQLTQRHGRNSSPHEISQTVCTQSSLRSSTRARCRSAVDQCFIDCHVNQLKKHVACEHVWWWWWKKKGGGGEGREGGGVVATGRRAAVQFPHKPARHSHKAEFVLRTLFESPSNRPVKSVKTTERRCLSAAVQTPTD